MKASKYFQVEAKKKYKIPSRPVGNSVQSDTRPSWPQDQQFLLPENNPKYKIVNLNLN